MRDTVDWLLHLGQNYPDLLGLLLGTAAGYALALILEAYFIPAVMPRRQQQGITVLVTVAAGAVLSCASWHVLDPGDPFRLRAVISLAVALLAPFGYPAVARFATRRFPSIGTIWQLGAQPEPPAPPAPPPSSS